jgi:hypothetical protein
VKNDIDRLAVMPTIDRPGKAGIFDLAVMPAIDRVAAGIQDGAVLYFV